VTSRCFGSVPIRGTLPEANYPRERALIGNTAAKPKSMEHLGFLGTMASQTEPAWRAWPQQKYLFSLRPIGAVQRAVLDGFAEVARIDVFGGIEVGDGSGYFEDAVVGTSREA
jgi:hypothetical protein